VALVDTLDPRIVARLQSESPARSWVVDTLSRAAADRPHASARLREAARDARKLRSRERRALFDVVYELIRRQSALQALGATTWSDQLTLWLEQPSMDHLPFATRAGCTPAIADDLQQAYGDAREAWLEASNARAPAVLRVNLRRTTRAQLQARLGGDGIVTSPLGDAGLLVEGRANLVGNKAFREGLFELQDHASQQVSAYVDASGTVLDLCAGAGGKSLALAASGATVFATDIRSRALDELRKRAKRARTPVNVVHRTALRTYDRVLIDAPCSGSGVWRRHPEFRWRLADDGVPTTLQLELLEEGARAVAPGGQVIYATCSALLLENEHVVDTFLGRQPAWELARPLLRTAPHVDGTDGMFAAALQRKGS
jgi:16S rRNA (cytosine967-C5)-methyltransferase